MPSVSLAVPAGTSLVAAILEGPVPVKATKLAHTAEAMLLAFFSLQDQLSREDAAVLAEEVSHASQPPAPS